MWYLSVVTIDLILIKPVQLVILDPNNDEIDGDRDKLGYYHARYPTASAVVVNPMWQFTFKKTNNLYAPRTAKESR
jgi:hypothetical protein